MSLAKQKENKLQLDKLTLMQQRDQACSDMSWVPGGLGTKDQGEGAG